MRDRPMRPGAVTGQAGRMLIKALAAGLSLLLSASAPAAGRLFPEIGNDGYDVLDYDLSMSYLDGQTTMPASVTIKAAARRALPAFSLDAVGQRISSVKVNDRDAAYRQDKEKLVITPAGPAHGHFTVRVDYVADRALNPKPPYVSPDLDWPVHAWVSTPDGFALMGQPDRAHVFFPGNDIPSDKARFTVRITAPSDRTAVASGTLRSEHSHDGTTTWVYHTAHPIPTDVIQIAVGRFKTIEQTGPGGLPIRSYVTTEKTPQGVSLAEAMERNARETPDQLTWLADVIGRPFPFEQYGVLGIASDYNGVALETATLSTFGGGLSLPPEQESPTLVHEMAHQYFGDAVSVRTWDDMWISEGHAHYYDRRYAAARGLTDLDADLKEEYQADQQHRTKAGPMGHLKDPFSVLFETNAPGTLMLAGLHTIVGESTFQRIEQTFFDRFRDRSASTQDYIDVANHVSGRDLTKYFHDWIYGPTTPPMPGHPDWHSNA
jgi:aminopeptidase N